MRPLRLAAAALALALLPGASPAAPPRDWSHVAARKPDGAFVEGNPNARVKLVEYLSFTCPHCARLEGEAIAPLTAAYIRPGLVSYEVRHALRDAYDLTAALLARCGGPRAFFAVAPVVYAEQPNWIQRADRWSRASPPPAGTPPDALLPLIARGAGFDALFAARGLPPAKAAACLAAEPERKLLAAMADEAWNRPGFPGTPAFLINGVPADGIASWAELDHKLSAALKK